MCILFLLFTLQLFKSVKVTQSRPTLHDPMDNIVYGFLQARILESVVIPFSRESSQPEDHTQVSHIAGRFFASWATSYSNPKRILYLNKGQDLMVLSAK